nr:MAG TPA: hypothetical protein [Caudoviricetes sp.]
MANSTNSAALFRYVFSILVSLLSLKLKLRSFKENF